MSMDRRDVLRLAAAAPAALAAAAMTQHARGAEDVVTTTQLGVGSASYGALLRRKATGGNLDLRDPAAFLEYCRVRGAGGIQIGLGAGDARRAEHLRERAEQVGMFVEGSIRLPADADDVKRFDEEVRFAKACGATVLRTVMLSGRRYETFSTAEEFRRFRDASRIRLRLAAPVVARHEVRLAVENHKDFRAEGLAELMRQFDSPHVGVCVDTGNNLALLDDPYEAVEILAPWAASAHLKDMAVEEYEQGFLLSEVPLGRGMLDLSRMLVALRRANPKLQFSLEMITRDPLEIPCLTDRYWATFEELPARQLARMLTLVRANKPKDPLPRVADLSPDERIEAEDSNVRRSLAYAAKQLDLVAPIAKQ
ncbi:MAG: sugar phosphate isomerase/epimerase family protein [Pirellulaceae bacterium]